MKRNYILFFASLILFVLAKLWFRNADNSDLSFLLTPTNWLIELFTASKSEFRPQSGYHFEGLNFLIDKSCSGFNFLLISFLMVTYLLANVRKLKSLLIIPVAIITAYAITILANVSRIASYIILLQNNITKFIDPNNTWLHRTEGILVYLAFLIISYFALNYIITKNESS